MAIRQEGNSKGNWPLVLRGIPPPGGIRPGASAGLLWVHLGIVAALCPVLHFSFTMGDVPIPSFVIMHGKFPRIHHGVM
jgi:hypothetical protein